VWSDGKPLIENKSVAIGLGIVFVVIGVACIHDAFDGRGDYKPFWTKFLPGL
jgi:uncharacterized membrane protein HdeD (DUF308 family)